MRIGLNYGGVASLEAQVQTIDEHVQRAVDAERDGFDSIVYAQIFGADALTVIALAGKETERIELGVAVMPAYPRHPFVMAQQALSVQAATGGRLMLGIGLSHKPVIENMWGLSYDKPARYMREYLSVLQPLLQGQPVSYQGEVFHVTGALQVPGATPPLVMIAALAPAMLRIAGEVSDGTVTWMAGRKTLETHTVPRINKAADAAGRPKPRIAAGLPVAVTDDPAAAREASNQHFQMYGQLPNYRRMLDIGGAAGPADVTIAGSEAEVEAELRALADVGVTDFSAVIYPVGDAGDTTMSRTRELMKSLVGKI